MTDNSLELPPPPPSKPFNLARLATLFAVVFVLAFGLCSVSLGSAPRWGKAAGYLTSASLITEALCFAGLLVLAVIAILRAIFPRS